LAIYLNFWKAELMTHQTHSYLANGAHAITVDLVGMGGTGSMLLTHLARLHATLQNRGYPGLHVRAFDPDMVERPNLIRQHYTRNDLGRNKAVVSIERINTFYGLRWQGIPQAWDEEWVKYPLGPAASNIMISCVDSSQARMNLDKLIRTKVSPKFDKMFDVNNALKGTADKTPAQVPLYWLDMGNGKDFGQVVLGTWRDLTEGAMPATNVGKLDTTIEKFGDLTLYDGDEEQGPSCSLLQALERQSLMVNPMVATHAAALLCELFSGQINYQGCYINLKTLTTAPIKVASRQRQLKLA
jgi:PRTRC genetic system ThiF family protein